MTVVLGIAQIIGPIGGGLIADHFGARIAIVAGAAMLALAAASSVRYGRATESSSPEPRG